MNENIVDKELALQISEGSHKAFEIFFMRYYSKVMGFLQGFLKSQKESEDLAQEVFIKLWNERQRLSQVSDFGAFIYIITRNTFYNYLGAKDVRKNHLQEFELEEIDLVSPHDDLVAKDLSLLIDLAIDRMPSQRQMVFRLSRMKGLSNQEIAVQLGLTKKTIENHLNLALKELKNAIMTIGVFFC